MEQTAITTQQGSISSTEDLPIAYDLHLPDSHSDGALPVVLFVHGFKGFKDWGPFPFACKQVAENGFAVVAINLSRNGVKGHGMEFNELDLFAEQTLSQDLDDVGTVVKAVTDGEIAPGSDSKMSNISLDVDRIGIIGHSRGGHTAIAAAAEHPKLKCLITWSAVANYNNRWSKEMIADWKSNGVTEIKNGRTGQIMPVKKIVYEDAQKNASRLMADRRIPGVEAPTLILHGQDDEAVPVDDANRLFEQSGAEYKNVIIIPETGHTFDGAHPFDAVEFPPPFKTMLGFTTQWLEHYLQK